MKQEFKILSGNVQAVNDRLNQLAKDHKIKVVGQSNILEYVVITVELFEL